MTSACIGGSGPTLSATDMMRVPADASMFRTNNFFLEPEYYLGRHIDFVYFSGDRRALRFYIATVRKLILLNLYDIETLASHHPHAPSLRMPAPFLPMQIRDSNIKRVVETHQKKANVLPTSGVMAAIFATQLGAKALYLSGIDFYDVAQKYHSEIPPRLRSILAPNMSSSGYDTKLHSRDLDLHIFSILQDKGISIFTVSPPTSDAATAGIFPLAPRLAPSRALKRPLHAKESGVEDWVAWDGWYPLSGLVLLRHLQKKIRRA